MTTLQEMLDAQSSYFSDVDGKITTIEGQVDALVLESHLSKTNLLLNDPPFDGAVAGLVGSGGVLPIGWANDGGSGHGVADQLEIVALGTDLAFHNLPYMDIRMQMDSAFGARLQFSPSVACAVGDVFEVAVYMMELAAPVPVSRQHLGFFFSPNARTGIVNIPTTAPIRFAVTKTATQTTMRPHLEWDDDPGNSPFNTTVRFYAPVVSTV